MTYCLGIKNDEGLVAIADTRITSGTETTSAKKLFVHSYGKYPLFLMTSGLRSVRDKAITYFQEVLDATDGFDKMYEVVNTLGDQIKRVRKEDKESLDASGLKFNIHTIVGGQMPKDDDHKLFLLYPEGNWIEIGDTTPFIIIGNSGYGKPILQRTITKESSINFCLKTGFLSFDSTRVSASDVGYPIDILVFKKSDFSLRTIRCEAKDLDRISEIWAEKLCNSLNEIPEEWIDELLTKYESHE